MDNKKFKFMLGMVLLAIIVCIILWIMAIVGSMHLTDGCFYRYNFDEQGNLKNSDSVSDTAILRASANYTGVDNGDGSIALDPGSYGKWSNSNMRLKPNQKVRFSIKGEVSLCRAYVPINNLQQVSGLDVDGKRIPIPRVEEQDKEPISMIMDARDPNWKNLTELYRNDEYYVAILKDQKTPATSTSVYNNFTKTNVVADCSEGSRTYNPICGRYTLWNGDQWYRSNCYFLEKCYLCHCRCETVTGLPYWPGDEDTCHSVSGDWNCDWCSCWDDMYARAPEPYLNDGWNTSPWTDNIASVTNLVNHNCRSEALYMMTNFQFQKYFWLSADTPGGLMTRMNSNINPPDPTSAGSGYSFAKIVDDQSFYNNSNDYKIIKHEIYNDSNVGYLQYRLGRTNNDHANNTGGYVLNIKQTKCRRFNGNGMNDVIEGRGVVQYVIAGYGEDPNTMTNPTIESIFVDVDGQGSITAPSDKEGYLWMKIRNAPQDYPDSLGQYNVSFFVDMAHGGFFNDVLNPLFEGLKTKIKDASLTVFKNMTCYQGIGGAGNCTNFFNYIKGLLILYIMFYGMMFLLGMVQISQTDLVTRVVKIALVAGLMNNQTFEFFSQYVFDFVTGFSDSIIANMSGYKLATGTAATSNPFMFMDEVFTKFFLSATFAAQIMALLSMGINGILYFIIIFVCIGMIMVVGFRAIAVYLMAYLAIAVLIGIAPLFLTFILFERTKYLFENWVKFTFRYMMEPTIMLAGIIILMQLFTIYLDYVIGYSVCWKCAIPFKLPFPGIPGFDPAFLDVELFCFNWFAPWGYDHRSSSMGVNMTNMVILLMLAYCMWGYIEFASKITAKLIGAAGPSATAMGGKMSGAIEGKALGAVGLDAESRKAIKTDVKARLTSMGKGPGESSLKGNRLDRDAGGMEKKGGKKPPPVPSRETQEYKDKKEKYGDKKEKETGKTPPPLPSKKHSGYEKGNKNIDAQKRERSSFSSPETKENKAGGDGMSSQKVGGGGGTPPPLPSRNTKTLNDDKQKILGDKDRILGNKEGSGGTSGSGPTTQRPELPKSPQEQQIGDKDKILGNKEVSGGTGVSGPTTQRPELPKSPQEQPKEKGEVKSGVPPQGKNETGGTKGFDPGKAGLGKTPISKEQREAYLKNSRNSGPGIGNKSTKSEPPQVERKTSEKLTKSSGEGEEKK